MADVRRLLKQERAARAPVAPSPAAAKRAARAAALAKPVPGTTQRKQSRNDTPDTTSPANTQKESGKKRPRAITPLVAYGGGSDNDDNSDGEGPVGHEDEADLTEPVTKRPKATHETAANAGSSDGIAVTDTRKNDDNGDADVAAGLPAGFFDAPKKVPEPAWKTEAQLAAEYARFEADLAVEEAAGAAELEDEYEDLEERRQRDLAVESAEQRTLEQRVEALRQARSKVVSSATQQKKARDASGLAQAAAGGPKASLQKAFDDEDIEYSYEDEEDDEEEDD
ncbi:hypothetical protein HDU86_000267 [Geranomyces michiganensis]|nr:hypothetical protein HDU86_000267 [Geranomyces michiganensis]